MINEERLLKTFLDLVKIDSPSLGEGKTAEYIRRCLQEHKIQVLEDDLQEKISGECGNLICYLPSNAGAADRDTETPGWQEEPGILFCAHMDTVTPCTGKQIQVDSEKDLIYTDGTTVLGGDDLAGVAAIMEAFIALKEMDAPHGDIWGLFTIGEEIGLYGSKYIDLEKTGIRAKYGYVLDSGGPIGTCDIQGPTQNVIKLRFRGKAAHAGVEPEKGINAIVTAAEAIASFPQGRIDTDTTCNVGKISGGIATNIVCDLAVVDMEVRSHCQKTLNQITDQILERAAAACQSRGGSVSMELENAYPAYKVSMDSPVIQRFAKACIGVGAEPIYEKTGGGSDTNYLNSKGIETVNLSVGMDKVHTTKEQIRISDLIKAGKLVYELCWR